jgi:hypothetical protein
MIIEVKVQRSLWTFNSRLMDEKSGGLLPNTNLRPTDVAHRTAVRADPSSNPNPRGSAQWARAMRKSKADLSDCYECVAASHK